MLTLFDPKRVAKCAGYDIPGGSGYRLMAINSNANQVVTGNSENYSTETVVFFLQSVTSIDGTKSKTTQPMFLHFRK